MLVPPQIAADWQNGAQVPFCLLSCRSKNSVSVLTSIGDIGADLTTRGNAWEHVWAGVRACFVDWQQQTIMFLSTIVQFLDRLNLQWFQIFSQDHLAL